MSPPPRRPSKVRKPRRDGWTPERQLRFLAVLVDKRSVREAAAAAGMSRESAYRPRGRAGAELFAARRDRALEGHKLTAIEKSAAPKSRGNPSKVTKWRKWKNPGFQAPLDQLRDFKETARCPSP